MKRPDDASSHAGQVSFPGGRPEAQDNGDLVTTALREAREELGLDGTNIDVIGALDDINTYVTDYDVTPVVGCLREEPTIVASESEVADWFWVDLAELLKEDRWRGSDIERGGRVFHIWFFDGAKHVIWGATAAMTRQLVEWIWDDMP